MADLGSFGALASVPLAALLGHLTIAQLVTVEILTGLANVVLLAASAANLKALVGTSRLDRANSAMEQVMWSRQSVGPPIGGALVSLVGPVLTVAVDAVSFLGSAIVMTRLRSPEPQPVAPARTHLLADLGAGFVHLWRSPLLRALYVNGITFGCGLGIAIALESYYALDVLGLAPWQLGLTLGLMCAGGLLGSGWRHASSSASDAGGCSS